MANTSKPNPLHGGKEHEKEHEKEHGKEPVVTKEVDMPGAGPHSDMEPAKGGTGKVPASTKAEMETGKKAVDAHTDQLKDEQEAGRRALSGE
jgi:hypothetical protein